VEEVEEEVVEAVEVQRHHIYSHIPLPHYIEVL
jgi:hypothetical protein